MLTTQEQILKWAAYTLCALALAFAFTLTLREVELLGARMFLPPLIVAVVASVEDTRSAAIFALAFGLLCDLTVSGTFPCVYTLAFTIAALGASLLAKSVLQPGVLCSVLLTVLCFAVTDALNMLALGISCRAPFVPMFSLAARETLLSLPLLAAVHPALVALHKKFTI